jgi:hypothetical protein
MDKALLAVVVTYIFLNHLQPYLELLFEVVRSKFAFKLERNQLRLEMDKCEVARAYPEIYKEQGATVIEGFQFDPEEENYEEDFDDLEEDMETEDKTIGYKINNKLN